MDDTLADHMNAPHLVLLCVCFMLLLFVCLFVLFSLSLCMSINAPFLVNELPSILAGVYAGQLAGC
jgi:hypothetical protein